MVKTKRSKTTNTETNKIKKGRIAKKTTEQKRTPRQIGRELEIRTYTALRKIGVVTIQTSDGYFDTDINKYVGTGDRGIDMIAVTETGETLYVQCKNWKSKIGVETIRSFQGAMNKFKINNGIHRGIIVGNTFTEHAKDEVKVIKGPSIILTTLEDIERTIINILKTPAITVPYNIEIENAKYIEINGQKTQVISIGENLKARIKDEQV